MKVEASRGVAAVEETKEKKHIFKMASNPINMKWYEWPLTNMIILKSRFAAIKIR